MAFSNKLKTQVDLPVWEWTRFAPTVTAKPSAAVSDWKKYFVGGTPRYGYYMVGLVLYRYDTQTDSWHLLSPPPITAPIYDMALEYTPTSGYFGMAIGPGPNNNTIQMAGLTGDTLVGNKIVIIGGTGAGQERTIVDVATPVVHDAGEVVVYTAGPPALIQDTNTLTARKTWQYNQWRNYQIRLVHTTGAGQNQIRKVLYNTNNALYYSDYNYANLHGYYAAPLATAVTALATWYQIESSIVYVNSNWTIPPDSTSRFMVKSGGLWMMAGFLTTPFYTLQYYDILADTWYLKGSQTTTLYSAIWDTYENAIETITEAEAGATTDWAHASPLTATVGAISVAAAPYDKRTLIDASQNMPINKYANQMIKIITGTGRGQSRTIIGNNRTTFIISRDWDVIPDSTSTYQVIGDSDKIYILPGRAQSTMGMYNIENDVVSTGRQYDFGTSRTLFADLAPKGIGSVTITNGGTGGAYAVGDILTLTTNGLYTGIGGKVKVETLSGDDVATVSMLNAGAGYFVSGTAYATTSGNEGGGNGTGCTITVVSNTIPSQPPIGITGITASAATNVGGILTATPTLAGTGYAVDDLLGVSGTGSAGIVRVTSVNSVGGVTGLAVEQQGSAYTNAASPYATTITTATAKNATATDFRAIASGATVTITVTNNAVATTGLAHNLKIGDVVWIGGTDALPAMTGQAFVGGLRTVAGVPSTTTFTYSIAGSQVSGTPAQVTTTNATNYAITAAVVNTAGTGYSVGDLLTCTTTGTGGTVRVTAVNAGAVTGVCLVTPGQGYASGSSATTGGGSSCTITLTAATTGVVNSLAMTSAGQGFGVITSAATSPTYTVGTGIARASVYNGGSGYAPGDLLSVAGGGSTGVDGYGGVVKVLTTTAANVTPAGAVLTVQIMAFGQGYTTGEKATTNLGNTYAATFCGLDGGGTGCTINVDAVGSVYSCAAAGGNNLLVNVTSVTSAGGMATVAVASGGTGYTTATAYTVLSSAAAAIFNAETLNTSQIVDFTKNWQPNELAGKLVETQLGGVAAVTGGIRRIIANSSHSIIVQPVITLPVSGTTKYVIFDAKSLGTESSYKTIEKQPWGVATAGTTGTLGVTGGTLIDNPTGLGSVSVVARGSGYSVNDVLTLATGTGGTVKVTAVTSGTVTAVEIVTPGTGYTINNIEETNVAPAGGTGCTIKILTTNAKNWDVNRWAGYKVKILAGKGVNSFPNECLIASNTATTLTLASNWVFKEAPDETTVYAIMENWGVCTALGLLTAAPTSGGTTYRIGDILLLTTGVGAMVKVLTVTTTGVPATYQVLNPGSGLTATTGLATTCYTNNATGATITSTVTVAGGSTIWNDPYQNWGASATLLYGSLVAKWVRPLTAAAATGIDYAITQVTNATQILTAAVTPDGNTAYAILGVAPRNATASLGVSSLMRLFGVTAVERARYMISWRGNNTPSIDRYDIVQDQWETLGTPPSFETYTLGSMFVYNGRDRIYFTAGVTNRVMYLDLTNNIIVPCSSVPYGHGTGLPGNRMFVMSNTDLIGQNLEYLYVMRHTGAEMWRTLIFW